MSVPNAPGLHDEIKASLADSVKRLRSGRQLEPAARDHLTALIARYLELPYGARAHLKRALIYLVCAHAADVLMHERKEFAQTTFDTLNYFEERMLSVSDSVVLTLSIYRALLASFIGKQVATLNSADRAESQAKIAPTPLVRACIWLTCSEVGYQTRQRVLLLKALKVLKRLDQTTEIWLLIHRVRSGLIEYYYVNDQNDYMRWHTRKADKLKAKLQLRLSKDAGWEPNHDQRLQPQLLQLLEIF